MDNRRDILKRMFAAKIGIAELMDKIKKPEIWAFDYNGSLDWIGPDGKRHYTTEREFFEAAKGKFIPLVAKVISDQGPGNDNDPAIAVGPPNPEADTEVYQILDDDMIPMTFGEWKESTANARIQLYNERK